MNIDLEEPAEFVPVQPGRSYHFHAYLRTDEITSDRGVQFPLTDPNHRDAVNVLTDNFTGTRPWTRGGRGLDDRTADPFSGGAADADSEPDVR